MQYQLSARVLFAAATFLWALAGSLGISGAGFGALGGLLISLPFAFFYFEDLKKALSSKYLWMTGLSFAATNASLALATDLLPLATFAAFSQLSPLAVLWIAPLWGEHAEKGNWGIALVGIAGALFIAGGQIESAPLGFLAAAIFIIAVSISSHFWGPEKAR